MHSVLKKSLVISACLLALAACSGTRHVHKEADAKPTLRLALLPQGMLAAKQPIHVEVKINDITTRDLILTDDLNQPLQIIVASNTLDEVHVITPQKTKLAGVYSFEFTPKASSGYRVWADVSRTTLSGKAMPEEFAYADLGQKKAPDIAKTESLATTIKNMHVTLSFDKPLTDDGDFTGTLHATDKNGNAVVLSGDIIGLYGDFHSIFRLKLDSNATFPISPYKTGALRLFAVLHIGSEEILVPFSVLVNKAN